MNEKTVKQYRMAVVELATFGKQEMAHLPVTGR